MRSPFNRRFLIFSDKDDESKTTGFVTVASAVAVGTIRVCGYWLCGLERIVDSLVRIESLGLCWASGLEVMKLSPFDSDDDTFRWFGVMMQKSLPIVLVREISLSTVPSVPLL